MMVRDITLEADGARRLDTTSALRSFVSPISLVFGVVALGVILWMVVSGSDVVPMSLWPITILGIVALVFASPLLTLFLDHLARSPLHRFSAFLSLLFGGLFQLFASLLAVGIVVFAVLIASSSDLREEVSFAIEDMAEFGAVPGGLSVIVQLIVAIIAIWFLWRAFKVESMLATPIQRSLVMGDVSNTGIWGRMSYLFGVPSSMWNARALLLPSFYLFIVARLLVYAVYWIATQAPALLDMSSFDSSVIWVSLGVFALVICLAHGAFFLAKRLAARRIWAEGKSNAKPPILFLRSFEDDQFSFRQSLRDPISWWLNLWSFRRNADEMMIDEFANYGPIIALGQPGESSTPFGAQRQYASHDDWQETIKDAAENAGAIVVAAGSTPGLAWEYNLLKSEDYLDKTVFIFPPKHQNPEDFKTAKDIFESSFGPLPEYESGSTLLGVWMHKGAPKAWTVEAPSAQSYLVLLREFMQSRFAARPASFGLGGLLIGIVVAFVLFILLVAMTGGMATSPSYY